MERLGGNEDVRARLRGVVDTDPAAYYEERWAQMASGYPTWMLVDPEDDVQRTYAYYVGGELAATVVEPADRPGEVRMTSELTQGAQAILPPLPLERIVAMVEQIYPPNPY